MKTQSTSTSGHLVASREEWLVARKALLVTEKEYTRQGDALAQARQYLPWVRIDKTYQFETEAGPKTLADLFEGRSQLIVYHFMFGPDYAAGCPSCSSIADGFNGIQVHLANHDVLLTAVSRAPLAKLQAYKKRMGWTFPWASSHKTDFNFDFGVSFTEEQQRTGDVTYNFKHGGHAMDMDPVPGPVAEFAASCGTDGRTYASDRPGLSTFIKDNGVIYHTYSAYSRGVDGIWGMYQWLDRAPKGRNETGPWWKRHDEYGKTEAVEDCCCTK